MIEYKRWRIVKGSYYFIIDKYTDRIYLATTLQEALEVAGYGR